jgi:hypothetical protein
MSFDEWVHEIKKVCSQENSKILISISHEMSNTGAPTVLFDFLEVASKKFGVKAFVINCREGDKAIDFIRNFPTILLPQPNDQIRTLLKDLVKLKNVRILLNTIAHLEWAAALTMGSSYSYHPTHKEYNKPTPQAVAAQEILDLYHWWTEEYPNRAEPHDVSGWSELCDRRRSNDPDDILGMDDQTKEQRAESRRILKQLHKIESEYEREEESMMIRLIKVRHSLWT